MFPLFNALLAPFYPALGLYTLYRRFVQKKSAASLQGQWGHISPEMRAFGREQGPRIWIHAVSVGETMAAKPILAALRAEMPEAKIALSNTTDAGRELAQKLLQSGEIDLSFGFPLDLPVAIIPVLNAIRPDALGFVETELWPNLLHVAHKRNIATFLLNGRVSDNLLKTAPKLGPLWHWMKGNVSGFLMRGEDDAERLRSLGVPSEKIEVAGDVKLEAPLIDATQSRKQWRDRLELTSEQLIVAGSTHQGEEALILRAFASLREKSPSLRLALAPRHLDRIDEVITHIEAANFRPGRRSQNERPDENAVYLLDTVGELADFYTAGDVAIVGGTLIPRGGHNLLEPVVRGVPVIFGPSVDNFRAAAELILKHGLGEQTDGDSLAATIERWIEQNSDDFPSRVEAVLAPHRGAAKRMAHTISESVRTRK
ncbi:3-deoxy-D-manno-octulosonic acid transferase [Abditibacteriota bacterium]|nr:3-deoxy-D-manno-octulosonic acid transferase [Abditibacteriota bacterium]